MALRTLRGTDELPPARKLVLCEPALGACRQQLPEPRGEKANSGGKDVDHRPSEQQRVLEAAMPASRLVRGNIARGTWKVGRPYWVTPTRVVGTRMIRHGLPVERGRAAHWADDMLVEAGEESESVLALDLVHQGLDAPLSTSSRPLVPGPSSATGMLRALPPAMSRRSSLSDLEAALDQLVRGAHAGDATAQHDLTCGPCPATSKSSGLRYLSLWPVVVVLCRARLLDGVVPLDLERCVLVRAGAPRVQSYCRSCRLLAA